MDDLAELTVADLLRTTVEANPGGLALIDAREPNRRWAWGDLGRKVESVALRLSAFLPVGSVLAIWGTSEPDWVILELACGLAGVVVQPIDPAADADTAIAALRRTDAAVVAIGNGPTVDRVCHVRRALPGVALTSLDPFAGGPMADALPVVTPAMGAFVLPTSGTTGEPKAVLLSHRAVTADARLVASGMALSDADTWLTAMPLHRSGGCVTTVVGCVATGAAMICLPSWTPGDVIAAMRHQRVTVFSAFPRALDALVDALDRDAEPLARAAMESVRLVQTGGAPLAPALIRGVARSIGAPVSAVYGLSEASPVLTQTDQCDPRDDPAESVGRPLPGTELAIVDPRFGTEMPSGAVGEIVARGPQIMDGYIGNPEATRRSIDCNGWLHTGDLGWLDDAGRLHVEGRLEDVIERDGKRWLPGPVERILTTFPGVAEAAVVGLESEIGSEAVAFVRLHHGHAADERSLIAHVAALDTNHLPIDRIVFLDELPALPSGKVRRFVLRSQAGAHSLAATG